MSILCNFFIVYIQRLSFLFNELCNLSNIGEINILQITERLASNFIPKFFTKTLKFKPILKFHLDQESRPTRLETGFGAIDFSAIESEVTGSSKQLKRKYLKWKEEDRYTIGKHASENGATAAVRKFKGKFPNLNESTVRGFPDRVEEELKKAKNNNIASKTSLSKYRYKTGRPLLLGDLDSMVQKYLLAASNRGSQEMSQYHVEKLC